MNSVNVQALANGAQNKPLILKVGQLFHGQVKQLYLGQTAEVQIGGQKLVAKLEVPMKAGDSYYFQVSALKPELQLKIISGPLTDAGGQGRQLNGLMDVMQLPKSAEMQALLPFVMKNKIPMTRESLLDAEALLKSASPALKDDALASIQKLVELKLPLTESTFRSLLGVESKEGLHDVLTSLKSALTADSSISLKMKEAILSSLEKVAKPFLQATGNALLGKAILTILDTAEGAETRFATLQLLKNTGVLPSTTSLANMHQVLSSLLTTENVGSSTSTLQVGDQATSATQPRVMPNGSQVNSTQTALEIIRMTAENTVVTPFRPEVNSNKTNDPLLTLLGHQMQYGAEKLEVLVRQAEKSDDPAIHKVLQAAETAVATVVDGKVMKEALQAVILSLGLNYESTLFGKDIESLRPTETLKPQLLALMQDMAVSPALREAAENVVIRMNGPLLQSGENGVQHQLVMQVPLEFFGKRIDATLQWNGRMKENGKIDADFARILFYLELDSLDKTIIDMQVQKRVVSVTVFNSDQTLKELGTSLQTRLREGLESSGYKLSGVFFKNFTEEKKSGITKKTRKAIDGQGVDFRI
ncbi:hypothetical protein [Filibacter tadaridae]|nr:hypothetical protein [Filibacter tadaridae]